LLIVSLATIGCVGNHKNQNNDIIDNNINYGSYYYLEKWYGMSGNDIITTGETRIIIKIINAYDNGKVKLEIIKYMTDYSHAIMAETIAENINEKYEFKFIDGWGNKAFGYIIFNDDGTITFYMDCNEYSDIGRMIGRLYDGETCVLQEGEIEFN
jgi:hypothetical protein